MIMKLWSICHCLPYHNNKTATTQNCDSSVGTLCCNAVLAFMTSLCLETKTFFCKHVSYVLIQKNVWKTWKGSFNFIQTCWNFFLHYIKYVRAYGRKISSDIILFSYQTWVQTFQTSTSTLTSICICIWMSFWISNKNYLLQRNCKVAWFVKRKLGCRLPLELAGSNFMTAINVST